MAHVFACEGVWSMRNLTEEDRRRICAICDILARHFIKKYIIGKQGNRFNWPQAQICKYAGDLCEGDEHSDVDEVRRYLTLCHAQDEPVNPTADLLPQSLGVRIVIDLLRKNTADIFTDIFTEKGHRRLGSLAQETGLSQADVHVVMGVLCHELGDQLIRRIGFTEAQD
jgi:hypothetical protein